jgi:hypothetical protein
MLELLRNKVDNNLKMPYIPHNATPVIRNSIVKNHKSKLDTVDKLRDSIAHWAAGKDDIPQAQREFYFTFGVDVLTAQTLNNSEMKTLMERVNNDTQTY